MANPLLQSIFKAHKSHKTAQNPSLSVQFQVHFLCHITNQIREYLEVEAKFDFLKYEYKVSKQ